MPQDNSGTSSYDLFLWILLGLKGVIEKMEMVYKWRNPNQSTNSKKNNVKNFLKNIQSKLNLIFFLLISSITIFYKKVSFLPK